MQTGQNQDEAGIEGYYAACNYVAAYTYSSEHVGDKRAKKKNDRCFKILSQTVILNQAKLTVK
jgi:hypothetical protein